MRHERGMGLLDLLVGTAVGLLVLTALTGALAAGARVLVRAGARAEASDIWLLAADAFLFDVRRAGWDPTASDVEALTLARADRVGFAADLDADGTIDTASAEQVTWTCGAATRRLSRLLGGQSMPLADGAVACGFAFLDDTGASLPIPAAGLDTGARATVSSVVLRLRLLPRGGGLPVDHTLAVALRSRA